MARTPRILYYTGLGYAGFMMLWLLLRLVFFDTIWWLALLNTGALYLFLPLPILLGQRLPYNPTGSASKPCISNPGRQRNVAGVAARRRSGQRCSSVLMAICPSRRASGAPTQ